MKKYPKMTFAALSAIALNFSCLATSHPLQHPDNKGTHNNIPSRHPTHLSAGEQISLLKNAITESNRTLAENILTGHMRKIGPSYYYRSNAGRFFAQMSDPQFEELQLFSLEDLKRALIERSSSRDAKYEIFELITAKFFEVTNNKEQVSKTTASKVYSNRNSFGVDQLYALFYTIPFPDSKREFVRHFLNNAKQDNNIDEYEKLFLALEYSLCDDCLRDDSSTSPSSVLSIFKNQPWLLQFIREYLEQTLSNTTDQNLEGLPIVFIKDIDPAFYNEKFFIFLKKCIIEEDDANVIDTLLPRYDRNNKNIPLEDRRLSSEYLKLALEEGHGGDTISSHIALYTDTSSDLTNVAQTLARLTQEERQETLKCIKDVNSVLYHSILEALQRLGS